MIVPPFRTDHFTLRHDQTVLKQRRGHKHNNKGSHTYLITVEDRQTVRQINWAWPSTRSPEKLVAIAFTLIMMCTPCLLYRSKYWTFLPLLTSRKCPIQTVAYIITHIIVLFYTSILSFLTFIVCLITWKSVESWEFLS